MATSYVYPYKVLPDAVSVEVVSTSPEVPLDGHRIDLRELTESAGETLTLTVRCAIDPVSVQSLLPDGADPLISATLGIREMAVGSHRRAFHVSSTGELDTTFELKFAVDDNWGKLELEPVVVLASDIDAGAGLANAAGSVLSWGVPLSLLFDTPEPFSSGSMLEVEWRNFEEDADLPDDALHALEIETRPRLLLNSGSAAAYDILRSEATHGTKARLRDMTFASIASEVWTSLIRTSYAALRTEVLLAPGSEPFELLDELGDWQRAVLAAWAPSLIGEPDPETALSELAATTKNDDVDPLGRLDRVLQEQLNPRRRFELLAQDALGD